MKNHIPQKVMLPFVLPSILKNPGKEKKKTKENSTIATFAIYPAVQSILHVVLQLPDLFNKHSYIMGALQKGGWKPWYWHKPLEAVEVWQFSKFVAYRFNFIKVPVRMGFKKNGKKVCIDSALFRSPVTDGNCLPASVQWEKVTEQPSEDILTPTVLRGVYMICFEV